jgi:acyl-coenzyme A thioesterase PaaI-like protein
VGARRRAARALTLLGLGDWSQDSWRNWLFAAARRRLRCRAWKPSTTIGFSIHYLAAGRGRDLLATARVIQRGGSICVVEVDVRGTDATAVSRATVTYKLSAPRAI